MTATIEFTMPETIEIEACHPKYSTMYMQHGVELTQRDCKLFIWFSIRDKDAARKADLLAAAIGKVLSDDWEELGGLFATPAAVG